MLGAMMKTRKGIMRKSIVAIKKIWLSISSERVVISIFLLAACLFFFGFFLFGGVKHSESKEDEKYSSEQVLNATVRAAVEGAGAAEKDTASHVILITLDKITYQDLLSFSGPVLTSLLKKSGLALMNVNTAVSPGTESGYLTIGSGSRLGANQLARKALNRGEGLENVAAEMLYCRHTGNTHAPPGEVLHLYSSVRHRLN